MRVIIYQDLKFRRGLCKVYDNILPCGLYNDLI